MLTDLSKVTIAILAGGSGTRLHCVVNDRPKVLAEVHGRPYLSFIFDHLAENGARNVVLLTGYKAEMVEQSYGERYKTLRIEYSVEPEPLGTGGAVRAALPMMESDPIMVMNGDSFIKADLNAFLRWFQKRGAHAGLVLTEISDTRRYGRVYTDENGIISLFEEKGAQSGRGWINAGVYLISREWIKQMPNAGSFSLEKDIFPGWAGNDLWGYKLKSPFLDIGTPEAYAAAENFFQA